MTTTSQTRTAGARAPARRSPAGPWARWWGLVGHVRDEADAESDAYRAVTPARVADRRVAVVLVTAALCLTAANFLGASARSGWVASLLDAVGLDALAGRFTHAMETSSAAQLNRRVFWGVGQVVCYLVVPLLVIRLVLRERPRELGLRLRGGLSGGGTYLVLLALVLPLVVVASFTEAFQAKYPFYLPPAGESLWPRFWAWEALYALQFLALEFFFRGFLVHGLRLRLGYAAVLVMLVPYNMLHFGKPMAEALAAIAGGWVLGTLSLKTRAIWWGVALHVVVATSMDSLSLWHHGVLG
ncbi:MAG: CPBP family intramembrane metalloprotease [Acidimicrobiia bacterium]|nr:CPBP family intramembrane metalloprotease [Acidimicrobiia bacterium]